jgi:hypothetical protein
MAGFTGAWATRTRAPEQAPLHPQRDPAHMTADPRDPNLGPGQTPDWKSSVDAPGLPEALEPGTFAPELGTGYGPVDRTPFGDHGYGLGAQPGLSTLDNQDAAGPWHNDDQGTVAAESYVHPVMRDGAPHVAWIPHEPEPLDSLRQVDYQRRGVGAPHDPNARLGKRLKRWYDRRINFHRYAVEMQPSGLRYAHPSPERAPVMNGDQTTSPYPNAAAQYSGPQDRFVLPMARRKPGNWVEEQTEDGTSATLAGAPSGYGLTNWGI